MKRFILFLAIVFTNLLSTPLKQADLIIFSYNRPLQLYALLESIEIYITGINHTFIICRAGDSNFQKAYQEVQKKFPSVSFLFQSTHANRDFKPLTMKAIQQFPSQYIIFAVDDIIVKDSVDMDECIRALEQTEAYGFFLRIGENTYAKYGTIQPDFLPEFTGVTKDILMWQFDKTTSYWRYSNTVDMTLYRKNHVIQHFSQMHFQTPNRLESSWCGRTPQKKLGLCFRQSKIINIPLNRIQNDFTTNPHMNFASPEELLIKFNQGKKIDINPLFRMNNSAPYLHYTPTFIER